MAVKYLPAVFAPPLLGLMLRHADSGTGVPRTGVIVRIAGGGVTVLALLALAFAPFWVGEPTFVGVRESGRLYSSWSPSGLLLRMVRTRVADPAAERIIQTLLVSVLIIIVLLVSTRVADSRQMLRGVAVIACASFALLPGGWAWYAALPLALVLCLPTYGARILVIVLTVTTRSVAAFGLLQMLGQVPYADTADLDGLIGVTIPGLFCLIVAIVLWRREPASAAVTAQAAASRGRRG